jgi:hypothetical protein
MILLTKILFTENARNINNVNLLVGGRTKKEIADVVGNAVSLLRKQDLFNWDILSAISNDDCKYLFNQLLNNAETIISITYLQSDQKEKEPRDELIVKIVFIF